MTSIFHAALGFAAIFSAREGKPFSHKPRRFLDPRELSPHLRRDLGFEEDGRNPRNTQR